MNLGIFPYSSTDLLCWSGCKLSVITTDGKVGGTHEFDGIINDVKVWGEKVVILVDKTVRICCYPDFNVEQCHTLQRRSSGCKIVNDECYIADKSGDVFQFNMKESLDDRLQTPILGHVSLILSIDVDDRFIYTAEQDEKIKISCRANPFVIDRFLLGHREFVNDVVVRQGRIYTTAGDGSVRSWKDDCTVHQSIFDPESVTHGLSMTAHRVTFAVCAVEQKLPSRIIVTDLDLSTQHDQQLTENQTPLTSCSIGDDFYWLIENEQSQIEVWKVDRLNTLSKVHHNLLHSARDTTRWTKLKKILEKSEAYDQYLREREEGFKNKSGRNGNKKSNKWKKRKLDESSVQSGTD